MNEHKFLCDSQNIVKIRGVSIVFLKSNSESATPKILWLSLSACLCLTVSDCVRLSAWQSDMSVCPSVRLTVSVRVCPCLSVIVWPWLSDHDCLTVIVWLWLSERACLTVYDWPCLSDRLTVIVWPWLSVRPPGDQTCLFVWPWVSDRECLTVWPSDCLTVRLSDRECLTVWLSDRQADGQTCLTGNFWPLAFLPVWPGRMIWNFTQISFLVYQWEPNS